MKTELKPCPFCKGIMTPIYNGNRENHVIYGWECSRSNCQFNLENGEMLLHRNMKKIMEMVSRITELEKSQVVWHRYPEEKPEPSYEYEVNIPVMIYSMNGCTYFADYNIDSGNFWRYGGKENNVSHWAYLPEAPKEEK